MTKKITLIAAAIALSLFAIGCSGQNDTQSGTQERRVDATSESAQGSAYSDLKELTDSGWNKGFMADLDSYIDSSNSKFIGNDAEWFHDEGSKFETYTKTMPEYKGSDKDVARIYELTKSIAESEMNNAYSTEFCIMFMNDNDMEHANNSLNAMQKYSEKAADDMREAADITKSINEKHQG